MEISGENYRVTYDPITATITCQGSFRHETTVNSEITELLNEIADQKPDLITMDLRELKFLNSSGLNVLAKFILKVRNYNVSRLLVRGSHEFAWQSRTLKSFQRLMPGLKVEFD